MTQLTQEDVRELFDYDPATGLFLRRKTTNQSARKGEVVGTLDRYGYLKVRIKKRSYKLHRIAWLYVHGSFPRALLDHVNGVRSDNRIANLRECNHSQNGCNMRPKAGTSSGIKGVSWVASAGKWKAQIGVNYKDIFLGHFDTAEEAGEAYRVAAQKYHGEFARLQ